MDSQRHYAIYGEKSYQVPSVAGSYDKNGKKTDVHDHENTPCLNWHPFKTSINNAQVDILIRFLIACFPRVFYCEINQLITQNYILDHEKIAVQSLGYASMSRDFLSPVHDRA